jgi:hypothetical protein
VGRGDVWIGLGVGIAIGFGVGYAIAQWRQSILRLPPPPPPPPGSLTTLTRDDQGRIIEIMEKPLYAVKVG